MYKYYYGFESDEHMFFAKEIAEGFGVFTINNNPHSLLIKAMIVDFLLESNIKYKAIFFETKNGLREVFMKEHYIGAYLRFKERCSNGIYISNNNKKYNFKLEGE